MVDKNAFKLFICNVGIYGVIDVHFEHEIGNEGQVRARRLLVEALILSKSYTICRNFFEKLNFVVGVYIYNNFLSSI
jgi:hypothetical protein